ncbi:MAG: EamA family transporter [Gammaproteobacteria bacterium]|nr:EamA family transporter [Gammaproteobacteria bacterium]
MLGALLALASAATFGLNNAAVRRGVLTATVLQAMAITVPMGVPFFLLTCLLFGGFHALAGFSSSQWWWMASAGMVHFIIGRYSNYRSIRALGANLSSPIQQLSVPISIILAIIFLDEVITPARVLGFILVMLGPTIMLKQKKGAGPRKSKSGFEPHYAEGFLWGGVSALAYGASPLFIMMGLQSNPTIIDSIPGGMISYSAATIVIITVIMILGGRSYMAGMGESAPKWFALSGFIVFFSQIFRYMSLAVAPVTVVVPIQRLSPVFRVIFGWLINRDHEFFGFWVLFGIFLSMFGAILLALSTDIVIALLPSSWAGFLQLSWP